MPYEMLPIQTQIWSDKYKFTAVPGSRLASDHCIEDTWRRVARALAAPEGHEQRLWENKFYGVLEAFQFIPAGRIIAGAGTGREVTLFNCFVQGTVPDSMEGIFQRLKEGALTMQQGGGIGCDFSTLRPLGADVKGVAAKASGPVSFMDVWDAMCKTIESAGYRRGAMMGTLRCDHPDIELFIDAKRDPARLRNFNVSVLVTNDFMYQVKEGGTWSLQFGGKEYNRIDARELWEKIMRSAHETAEPGVIFIDRINEKNNLAYCETIAATNPCAEQPLPPEGACLLGSINLAAFIRHPFEPEVYWDEHAVIATAYTAVRMMDNVIDISNYPLPRQREEATAKRRIGLGITGLADALAMCGLHYGSPEACRTAAVWMKMINGAAYDASMSLAEEKGRFPLFSQKMGDHYYRERGVRPMRNSHVTSIAPTGTISLLAGNISSGIEPIYEFDFIRNITKPDGSKEPVRVEDYAVRLFRAKFPDAELPSQFLARAHDLSPKQHLAMQAALQPHVDSSISKTVNCPENITFEDFEALYMDAYDQGLKACAAFRKNAITGSILEAPKQPLWEGDLGSGREREEIENIYQILQNPKLSSTERAYLTGRKNMLFDVLEAPGVTAFKPTVDNTGPVELTPLSKDQILDLIHEASGVKVTRAGDLVPGEAYKIVPRAPVMEGKTHKITWGAHAIYITINDREDGSPYEIFINSKHAEHYAWSVALTRMISAIWRRGGDTGFVTEELKAIHDPRGGAWMGGRYIPSVQAAIGHVIEAHIRGGGNGFELQPEAEQPRPNYYPANHFCPKCHSYNVVFPKAGCLTCRDCDFSNCD